MSAQQTFRNTLVVLATLAAAYALAMSVRILIVLLVAIIIASAVRPAVLWLRKLHVPYGLAILIVYFMLGLALFVLSALVFPPVISQIGGYINNDQGLAVRIIDAQNQIHDLIKQTFNVDIATIDPNSITNTISTAIDQVKQSIPTLATEFGALAGDFILVVVMGVYWLTSRDQGVNFLLQLFPIGRRAEIATMIHEIENSMGAYVRGIALVSTFVGVANFAILSLFHVPNAVTLGFIVGITTALPIVGGYIGAFTATLLALLSSPLNAVIAFGSFVAVQQIENHYLTPRVMSRSVNLNPILVIVFLFIGFAVGGVVGALISVPIAGTLNILLLHLVIQPRQVEAAPQFVDGGILLPQTIKEGKAPPVSPPSEPVHVSAPPTS